MNHEWFLFNENFFCLFVSFAVLSTAKETKCYPHKDVVVEEIGAGYASRILGNFYKEYWPFTCEDGTELTVKIDEIDETIIGGRKKKFLIKEKYLGKLQKKFKKWREELGVVLGHFVDDSDDRKYGTTKIGSQVWMSENLKKGPWKTVSFSWDEALNACPDGWHLPSRADFEILLAETESTPAASHLRAKNVWTGWTGGDDLYGFSATPNIENAFDERAEFWSSTPIDSNPGFAYHMFFLSDPKSYYSKDDVDLNEMIAPMQKEKKLAIRCVKDKEFTYTRGFFVDSRDGQSYKTVTIGNQTWMAENLNYAMPGSVCLDNEVSNCAKYGQLYNLDKLYKDEKKKQKDGKVDICPAGWRIPSEADFDTLIAFVGGKKIAGIQLKSRQGWPNGNNGTDAFGFSVLPSGTKIYSSFRKDVARLGLSSEYTGGGPSLLGSSTLATIDFDKRLGINGANGEMVSIRCIADSEMALASIKPLSKTDEMGGEQSDSESLQDGSFVDSRDGNSYRTVEVVSYTGKKQIWMAENLNYSTGTTDDMCYNNKKYNCKKYGRFYKWNAAIYACPNGWHLPGEPDSSVFSSNIYLPTINNNAWTESFFLSNGKRITPSKKNKNVQNYDMRDFGSVRCIKD